MVVRAYHAGETVTLPVPKEVADASLDAAILLYLAKHPGAQRREIECTRAVAIILCHAPNPRGATEWLHDRLQHLRETGAVEARKGCHGWFVVERAA